MAKVSNYLKMLHYNIFKINFTIRDDYFKTLESEIDGFNKFNIDINTSAFLNKDVKNNGKVVLNISLNKLDESGNISDDKEKYLLSFQMEIEGVFQSPPSVDDDFFKKLISHNAPSILFSISRGIITSYTAQAGVSPIILPLMDFSEGVSISDFSI